MAKSNKLPQGRYRALILAGAAGLVLSSQAGAQAMLEEVVVTAQKREQNLQDVPIAVAAYSGQALQENGVKDIFELQTSAPGLVVDQNQSATTSSFSIRGIGTGGNNFGQESSVGLYVDGVYRSRQSSMISQLVDIASVDVLRGPQGTLFGRNTLSGAIQFKSVKPDHEGTGFVEVTAGNYGLLNFSGATSMSLIEDELAIRFTGSTSERDGWIDNLNTPGDDEINNRDRWGWRLQALYTPTDELTVHFIVDDSEIEESCCGTTVMWDNNRVDQRFTDGRFGSDALLEPNGGTFISENRIFDRVMAINANPDSRSEDSGWSVEINYDFSDEHTLTSITGYREFTSYDFIDADFTDLEALTDENLAEQESISQELRVAYTGESLNYVAGVYYFEQSLDSVSTLGFGEHTELLAANSVGLPLEVFYLFFGGQGGFFPPGAFARDVNNQDHESWAVFGQFDFVISDAFTLTAGLRYSDERKELSTIYTESDAVSFGFTTDLFPPTSQRPNVDELIEDSNVSGTIKLSWFADEETMFYVSYGTGYKAGGTNTDRIGEGFEQVFDAETADSVEVGVKTEFPEQAIRLNVSLYKTDVDDLQVGTFTGSGFNLQNAATAETWGGEVEMLWQATESTTVTASYAKTVADFGEFERGNCWIATPFRFGTPDPGGVIQEADGSLRPPTADEQFSPTFCERTGGRLGTNPEDFFNLNVRQEFYLSDSIEAFATVDYTYTGDMILDQSNDPLSLQDSYGLINLRAGILFNEYDAELTFWGRNVADKEYTSTSFPGVLQDGKVVAYPREPVTYGITLRKDW